MTDLDLDMMKCKKKNEVVIGHQNSKSIDLRQFLNMPLHLRDYVNAKSHNYIISRILNHWRFTIHLRIDVEGSKRKTMYPLHDKQTEKKKLPIRTLIRSICKLGSMAELRVVTNPK